MTKKDWEKEFEKRFVETVPMEVDGKKIKIGRVLRVSAPKPIKQFINSLLAKQKEEIMSSNIFANKYRNKMFQKGVTAVYNAIRDKDKPQEAKLIK